MVVKIFVSDEVLSFIAKKNSENKVIHAMHEFKRKDSTKRPKTQKKVDQNSQTLYNNGSATN